MKRRTFIKRSGLLAAGAGFRDFMAIAGPFTRDDFSHSCAPLDKKLNQQWVQSLYERGSVTTYTKSKNELMFIGMPVGGICCGTLYVGGDGRLWVWDIFNKNQLGAVHKVLPIKLEGFNVNEITNVFGTLYLEPATENVDPLLQGIALVIQHGNETVIKQLHQDDWDEIAFEATYPVATIRYTDKALPIEVSLHAFAPFIPGDPYNSGLPATIQSVSIKNKSSHSIQIKVLGWLENKMLLNTAPESKDFRRYNNLINSSTYKGVALQCQANNKELEKAADFGNMAFITTNKNAKGITNMTSESDPSIQKLKDFKMISADAPVALITADFTIKSNQETTTDFIITWYTPNISFPNSGPNQSMTVKGADFHFYTKQFKDAASVAAYIANNFTSLKQKTFLWKETWYDSTLPWWFLERTFSNISTLATSTAHRFQSGRFYAWEGVGCCHGTCTHVWQYAQAMSRIFPELERDTRERVDLGVAFDDATGAIGYRGENTGPSIDGQAGTVLRIYREYLMSSDGKIVKDYWPKIKKAVVFVMQQDKNQDGMEDTPMENTLDAKWSGEISWIVGLCIAGVLAGQKMAEIMKDTAFAEECKQYVEKGRKNMEQYLFNGEYFIHRPDPSVGKKEIGSYNTCHIDQVYGQQWAWQVGLGRILDKEKTLSALKALWKYNYMPDVGPYIKNHPGGRFYALAGEGGMVMNTNPYNDPDPYGSAKAWQLGYFSECMSGFEHQVAAHMMAEGMTDESLVLTRTIHDRYYAGKRNPFNEIECSDHYARAMASYGTFLMACGFESNGPEGYIRFSPKWNQENFKAPFTAAGGWGSYQQKKVGDEQIHMLNVKEGTLRIQKMSVTKIGDRPTQKVIVVASGQKVLASFMQQEKEVVVQLDRPKDIQKNEELVVTIL